MFHLCRRYHYCVDPDRQLFISPLTFLSSASFLPDALQSVFLLWSGSNGERSPVMSFIESEIQQRLQALDPRSRNPILVLDRFSYGGQAHFRPTSMTYYQNARAIIYSGYSVGCSGFAELYSLGNIALQRLLCELTSCIFCRRAHICPFCGVSVISL